MYLLIEFPSIDSVQDYYKNAKLIFTTRCSCLGRSETNPKVSFFIYKDDVNQEDYNEYLHMLQNLPEAKFIEVEL